MKKSLTYLAVFALPVLAFAQEQSASGLITKFGALLSQLVPLLIGLAVVIFLFGVLRFIFSGDNDEKRKSGAWFMAYGILGLFVMVSIWGLVSFLGESLGIEGGDVADIPGLPTIEVEVVN